MQGQITGQEAIENPDKLRTKAGMESVFLEMRQPNRTLFYDHSWRHLEPWNFLAVPYAAADQLKQRRRTVPVFIDKALQNV